MSELIKLGIIGAGTMGGVYAKAIAGTDLKYRTKVQAVCDVDLGRARELARSEAVAYSSVEKMLQEESLDCVYLATPDPVHRTAFEQCMEAKVACLVEKPLATNLDDARAMRAAAQSAGVYAEVNFTNHFNPPLLQAKAAVDSGVLGPIVGLFSRLSNVISVPRDMLSWAGESTVAWFLLSHTGELATWLTGWQPVSVLARGSKGKLQAAGVDTWDLIQTMITFDSGKTALFENSWVLPESMPSLVQFDYVIHGELGQFSVDVSNQMVTSAGSNGYLFPGTLDWTQSRISAFLDALAGPLPADGLANGVIITALLEATHRSLLTGQVEPISGLD